ncbi:MAG: hypothetical protein IT357_11975 [Gemmatimonadaceae bacterium]|nr:hypothetical protein [Gemmatimonadaceae bacterium]
MAAITRERAERIGKSHACTHCKEYSFKKLVVKPAPESITAELGAVWVVTRTCGVCGYQSELGLEADGDIVFES